MSDSIEFEVSMPNKKSFWSGRTSAIIMLLLFAMIPLAPLAMTRGREEILLWQTASALKQFDSGEHSEGLEKLRLLATKQPDSDQVQRQLIDRLIEADQFREAVQMGRAMYQRVLDQVNKQQIHPANLWTASGIYSQSLVPAGKPAEALAVLQLAYKKLEESQTLKDLSFESRLEISNGIAYHAALAGQKLDYAAILMEEIFATIQLRVPFGKVEGMTIRGQTVLGASLISLDSNEPEQALRLLDPEIALLENVLTEFRKSILLNYFHWMTGEAFAAKGTEPEELADVRKGLGRTCFELSMLLAVRSLVLEKISGDDHSKQAVRDRFRISELGYEGQTLLDLLPDIRQCTLNSIRGSMFLDTAGLIFLKQGNPNRAMQSLDLACVANDIALKAINERLGESPDEMLEPESSRKIRGKMSATLHLHRGQCHQRMGNRRLANADFEHVKELGFEKGDPNLF